MRNLLLALMGCVFLSMELMAGECVTSEWGPNDEIGLPIGLRQSARSRLRSWLSRVPVIHWGS